MNSDISDKIISLLNEFVELDPDAIKSLIYNAVECNDRLANHPGIFVSTIDSEHYIRFIGLLNSVLEYIGAERIAEKWSDSSGEIGNYKFHGFCKYTGPVW